MYSPRRRVHRCECQGWDEFSNQTVTCFVIGLEFLWLTSSPTRFAQGWIFERWNLGEYSSKSLKRNTGGGAIYFACDIWNCLLFDFSSLTPALGLDILSTPIRQGDFVSMQRKIELPRDDKTKQFINATPTLINCERNTHSAFISIFEKNGWVPKTRRKLQGARNVDRFSIQLNSPFSSCQKIRKFREWEFPGYASTRYLNI